MGKTARHGTYFEMLGNFSFGDYFKHEATAWAWEFCTQVLEMPADRIWISVYENDDEAVDIWVKEVGIDPSHIVRLGKEDNFWEHGSGPCGPCSELYFDRGEKYGCGSPTCGVGCDCDRYVEFWNIVFSQFNSDGKGNYPPMEHPNIDTGMGLERLACIMQGVDNLFEVDTVQNIMKHVSRIAGVTYGQNEKTDVSLRVITDHVRSTVFMIGDGVMSSNEGRGYVLRRLLRRASRHGRLLGIHEPFLYQVCDTVIQENLSAYPQLKEKEEYIKKLIRIEEEAFGKTIDSGLELLDQMRSALQGTVLSGEDAFKLYDTYGFPVDLTKDILEEQGITVDEEGFNALMAEQRERARGARKNAGMDAWKGENSVFQQLMANTFVGYERMECEAAVKAVIKGNELADSVAEGEEAYLVLDVMPFYAESGGQVGDIGTITAEGAVFEVANTVKSPSGVSICIGVQKEGELSVGQNVRAQVDRDTRLATMRNHTAAHLLQAALRRVLGTHVEQAGQLVDSRRMRFDFTHFSALTGEELRAVEDLVNQWILDGMKADIREMPIDEARRLGAMALFGEKYGDVVRVVRMGDVSMELCGGTHVDNTSKLGLFHILSESSVASGVRRIEAVTGGNVVDWIRGHQALLAETAETLKAGQQEEVPEKAAQLTAELKAVQKELEALKAGIAAQKVEELLKTATEVEGLRIVSASFPGTGGDAVRGMCDRARDAATPDTVVVLAGIQEDKGSVSFGCYCGPEAVRRGVKAGDVVREVAKICGGKGGGRPDIAMAGGRDLSKVDEAVKAAASIAVRLLNQ